MKITCGSIFLILLTTISNCEATDWVVIKDHSKVTVYADPNTVHTSEGTVKLITLWDFKAAMVDGDSGKTYMSQIGQDEFDCTGKEMRLRPRYITVYDGYMGEGGVVTRTTNAKSTPWINIAPNSGAEVMWKYACGGSKS